MQAMSLIKRLNSHINQKIDRLSDIKLGADLYLKFKDVTDNEYMLHLNLLFLFSYSYEN